MMKLKINDSVELSAYGRKKLVDLTFDINARGRVKSMLHDGRILEVYFEGSKYHTTLPRNYVRRIR